MSNGSNLSHDDHNPETPDDILLIQALNDGGYSKRTRRRSDLRLNMTAVEVAAAGAAASLSLADVDYKDVGKKEGSQFTLMGVFTLFLTGGSATFSVLSIVAAVITEGSPVAIAAGAVALFLAPVAMVQRFRLSKMATFREVHNALRADIERMTLENQDLESQILRLAKKSEQVQVVEAKLQNIVTTQGSSVGSLVNLVKENGRILVQMDELLMAQVTQQLMTTVVRSDRNQDFQINQDEVESLILQIRAINGVDLDERKLRVALQGNKGVDALFDLIKEMKATNKDPKRKAIAVVSRSLIAS